MEARELRIGNWVIDPHHAELYEKTFGFVEITSLTSGEYCHWRAPFIVGRVHSGNKYENIQPIPLTPEILKKAGFSQSFTSDPQEQDASQVFKLDELKIHKPSEKHPTLLFFADDLEIELKHVHQLQNLFYCLTGTELNIQMDANL